MEGGQIVVVGGGPVGLVTALALATGGVPVTVLEAGEEEVPAEWRGSTLHPPTLRLLDLIGMAETAVSQGVQVDRVQYRDLELGRSVEFDYHLLDGKTRFPFRIQYEQYKLLRNLRAAAAEHPKVDLVYDQRVTAVTPHADTVTATVEGGSGATRRIDAPWLVGADGSRSVVRNAAGIQFPGDTYPTLSLVAATHFDLAAVVGDLAPVSYWTGPEGRMSLIRTPDTWRVALSTGDTATHGALELSDPRAHPRLIVALDRLVGDRRWADVPLGQHQRYRSHQRVASRFRAGRTLLVGDAAHLSSTTGGMGLNSGIHDAFDLAGRLADSLCRGDNVAAERAADEYAAARHWMATRVVQPATRAARTAVDSTDRSARAARLDELGRMASDPGEATRHLCEVSMLYPTEGVDAS